MHRLHLLLLHLLLHLLLLVRWSLLRVHLRRLDHLLLHRVGGWELWRWRVDHLLLVHVLGLLLLHAWGEVVSGAAGVTGTAETRIHNRRWRSRWCWGQIRTCGRGSRGLLLVSDRVWCTGRRRR